MPGRPHPLVPLPGSERAPLAEATSAGPLDTSERAEVTLVLRRRARIPAEIVEGPTVLTRDELAERYGADPADVDLIRRILGGQGLEVTAVDRPPGGSRWPARSGRWATRSASRCGRSAARRRRGPGR